VVPDRRVDRLGQHLAEGRVLGLGLHPLVAGQEGDAAHVILGPDDLGRVDARLAQPPPLPGRRGEGPVDQIAELRQLQGLEPLPLTELATVWEATLPALFG